MTLFVPNVGRVLLQAMLLLGAIATVVPGRVQARTTGATLRYTSAAYGYSLRAPASWERIPGVRWTPAGPPADLTVMTPDHQAAFGVMVAPTGDRVYSDLEIQDVALRLLAQENQISPVVKIETKRVVVNGVAYQAAGGYLISGSPLMASVAAVAVTQRHHRLYAIANLAYLQVYTAPPAGPGFSPTDTPVGNAAPPQRVQPAAVSTVVAARADAAPGGAQARGSVNGRPGGAGVPPVPALNPRRASSAASATRPQRYPSHHRIGDFSQALAQGRQIFRQRPLAPPAPLPTDRLRGNRCRTSQDAGLAVVDRNCAFNADRQALVTIFSSFTIDPATADDGRPAAAVGVDGFRSVSDPAQGYRIAYPAQWARVPTPGTLAFARSADQNAGVGVTVAPIDAASLSEADLRAAADHQLATVATYSGALVHRTVRAGGATYVIAFASGAGVTTAGGGLGQAQVVVVATAARHRLYTTAGIGLTVRGAGEDSTPILYPYFAPFSTLARRYQSIPDTHAQEVGLALRAALTLFVDPRAS